MASLFEADIASLKGVGPKRAELFRKLGAPTVGDLLRLYPRAYEDWRDAVPIRNTRLNEVNIVKGTVLRRPVEQRIRGGMTLYKTTITDDEDDMQLTFFNNRYITSLLTEGAVYAVSRQGNRTFMRRRNGLPGVRSRKPHAGHGACLPADERPHLSHHRKRGKRSPAPAP